MPALATFMALVLFMMLWPALAGSYTVEEHDDAVTGQFVISPTKVELEIKPGESAEREIAVANRTGSTITIEFSMEDFEGSTDPSQATVFFGDEDSSWGARKWLEPELASIVLKQGETVTFRTKINVPKNAEPGGHYAALFAFSTYETEDESGTAINITSRVGTLFLIKVAGTAVETGNLSKPEISTFSEYGPIDIGLIFNNEGNIHLKPSGRVIITNILGQSVAEIAVPEWVVLPESSRRNMIKWDSHYLFGRYTARAEIGYTSDGAAIIQSTNFWVIPWKFVLAIALGIGLFIAFISWLVRRKRGRRYDMEEELEELRAAQNAVSQGADAADAGSVTSTRGQEKLVALNALFPSTGDASIIDLQDEETRKLIGDLIRQHMDLADAYISEGKPEEAHTELMEARVAAQLSDLLFEIGVIDDMLRKLQ
ncbi:MAG: COG1470 family protein [Thermoleophilia bacterium]